MRDHMARKLKTTPLLLPDAEMAIESSLPAASVDLPPWMIRAQERLAEGAYPEFAAWMAWIGERLGVNADRLTAAVGAGTMIGLYQAMSNMSEFKGANDGR